MTGETAPQGSNADMTLLRRRNLRDLGGLPTRGGGRVVKPRCLFRSSAPSEFDPEEGRALASLELRCAVDLRTDAEVRLAGTLRLADVQQVRLPLFQSARQNWISPADQSPRATAERYFEMLQTGLHAIAAVIAQAARPDTGPLLIFCSAGRDRTGIVVACLLELLEVTDDAVAMDYAQSDSFDRASGRAHAGTVHELLALVRRRYESVERMLAPHGVTTSVRQLLRRQLVTHRA